jgi:hypothetical protein
MKNAQKKKNQNWKAYMVTQWEQVVLFRDEARNKLSSTMWGRLAIKITKLLIETLARMVVKNLFEKFFNWPW